MKKDEERYIKYIFCIQTHNITNHNRNHRINNAVYTTTCPLHSLHNLSLCILKESKPSSRCTYQWNICVVALQHLYNSLKVQSITKCRFQSRIKTGYNTTCTLLKMTDDDIGAAVDNMTSILTRVDYPRLKFALFILLEFLNCHRIGVQSSV